MISRPGWSVLRCYGSLGVDRVRSYLASEALLLEPRHDWWFWVDSDMWADSEAEVDALLASAQEWDAALMSAASVCRGSHELNVRPADSRPLRLGPAGGVVECEKAAFAFAVTHRRFFEALIPDLPEVDYRDDGTGQVFTGYPFFHPLIRNRTHYGEDYSCCLRARDAGLRLYADTRIRNYHAAEEPLSWEHLSGVRPLEAAQ